MNTIDEISLSLENIQFSDINQYIQELLFAFKIPNSTIKRLLEEANQKSFKDPIYVFKRAAIVYDLNVKSKDLVDSFEDGLLSAQRILIVINSEIVICKDFITDEQIEFKPNEIHRYINFFIPLIFGRADERDLTTTKSFAELIGSLFNRLFLDDNNKDSLEKITDYILSLIYFSFSSSITDDKEIEKFFNHVSGSHERNYNSLMQGLFDAVLKNKKQSPLFDSLPYWGAYSHTINTLPNITSLAFDISAKILAYDLANIDPEILGSLVYKLIQNDESPTIYGHQTSSHNVSKLLSPLFINKYEKLIEVNKDDKEALNKIKVDLLSLTFFDPTNGPGCFLNSSFNAVAELIALINNLLGYTNSREINFSNFIGLVDNTLSFKLSHLTLWVSYLQYLIKIQSFKKGDLVGIYNIVNLTKDDQLKVDWENICPNNGKVFIIGSPVFKGAKKTSDLEKKKMQAVFNTLKLGDIDYSACWLYQAAKYIKNSTSQSAFVVTNSLCQGTQVAFLWRRIYDTNCDISFAYRSFKWKNNAKSSTGVSVIIIGLVDSNHQPEDKYLYEKHNVIRTKSIGPYLVNSTKTIVEERARPLSSQLPIMQKGNMPYDGQNLLLTKIDKDKLIKDNPSASKFLKRIIGSKEYINNIERWCLWIKPEDLDEAMAISEIRRRIRLVREFRLSKSDSGARRLADRPYQFREFRSTTSQTLVIPSVSSENRPYIPIGFVGEDTIISNLSFAIYDCEPWIFGLISSQMHMVWIRTVCGSLETRLRYSSQLGYNTFPFPQVSNEVKDRIKSLVLDIISEREKFSERSLGELYNELPESLKIFHTYLDKEIDSCYQAIPFSSDMERIKLLFNLYENNIKQNE